jgi:hypothetical protein
MSFDTWKVFNIHMISEYHGFELYITFEEEMKKKVPDFNWDYQSYVNYFEISKSPLWKAFE